MDWKSFAPSALSHAQKLLVSFINSDTLNQHSDLDILDPLSTDFGILRVTSESPNKYHNIFSPVEINNNISSNDQSNQNVKTHLKISNTYSNVDSQISSRTKLSILNSNTNLYNICVNNNPIHNEICKKNNDNVDTSTMKNSVNYDNYNDFTTPDSCDYIKINKRNLFQDEIFHSIPCDKTPIAYDDFIHFNDDSPGLTSFYSCQTHNSIENNLSDDITSENTKVNGSLTIIKPDLFEPIITEHDTSSFCKIDHLNEIFKMRDNKILELSRSIANLHSMNDSLKDQLEFLRNIMNVTDMSISLANNDFDKDDTIKQLFDEGNRLSQNELLLNNIIKKLKQKNIESDIKLSLQGKNNDEYDKKLQLVIEQCNELRKHNREYIHKITLLKKDVSSLSIEKIEYLSRITEVELQLHNLKEKMSVLQHDSSYHILENKMKPFSQFLQQELSESLTDSPCSKFNSSTSILEHELLNLRNYIYLQEQKSSFIVDGFKQEIEELRNFNAQNVFPQHNLSDAISSSTLPLLKEIDELRLLNSDEVEKCANLKSKFEMEISILENERNLAEEETKRLKIDKDNYKVINKDLDNMLSIQQSELHQTLQQLDVIKIQIKQCQIELKEKENQCSRLKQSYFEINNVFQEKCTKQLISSSLTNSNYKIQSINDSAINIIPNFDHLKILPVLENSTNDILKIPISHSSFISNVELSTWSSASQLNRLQIIINIKDGQIEVLKMENSHLHKTSKLLSDELLQLLNSNQEKSNQVKNLATLKNKFKEVNIQYQTLLEMYGEKLEQNQELQFDLLEMKELYKIQTEELLNNMYSNIGNS